ncbi:MAG: PilZ domain-containing protein [Gammaproteobacteria bacterium]
MSHRKSYRKILTSEGLIYLGNEELKLTIRNLSLTGLYAELSPGEKIRDINDVFMAISASARVDIYLKELQLAGEAEVVRAEVEGDTMLIALEFKNISYDVNDLLYKRRAYRKSMEAVGHIVLNGELLEFHTHNVSVDGMMIHVSKGVRVMDGTCTHFDFDKLGLKGETRIVWSEHERDGGTLLGLEYVRLENVEISGIPRFAGH